MKLSSSLVLIAAAMSGLAGFARADEIDRNRIPVGTTGGDPHFKTWTGMKYDYHGECDLVLLNNPSFADGKGLSVHIRTTRVNYYSYIESVAVRIGDEVLQFDNDVDNFLLNGEVAPPQEKWVNQYLSEDYHIVRYKKAVSIRLDESSKANIDLIRRTTGFPTVRITAGSNDDILKGSTGLLGEYGTGRTVGRDGATVFEINGVADEEGATAFALEWQVRPNEDGMIFKEARFPQYPEAKCTPPKKQSFLSKRLGSKHMEEIARDACKGWKLEDIDDCIFDVIATRDVAVAAEAGAGDEEFVMYEGVEEI